MASRRATRGPGFAASTWLRSPQTTAPRCLHFIDLCTRAKCMQWFDPCAACSNDDLKHLFRYAPKDGEVLLAVDVPVSATKVVKFAQYVDRSIPETHIVYLDCPFEEKNYAKGHGAKWNPAKKKWFVPYTNHEQLLPLSRWL
ncbi:hypothetical protein FOA52_008877 [Chlamydomonas sp. UWO 241]|nr:hypothetical protein FOA52_008877 [Chlamydomonas sp. UWO 241]